MDSQAWFFSPARQQLVRIVFQPGAGFQAISYYPDFSFMTRQETSWSNTLEGCLAWVAAQYGPELMPLDDLGDHTLYRDPHASEACYPQVQTKQDARFSEPILGRDVPVGTRLSVHAGGYFECLYGLGSVDFETQPPVLVRASL